MSRSVGGQSRELLRDHPFRSRRTPRERPSLSPGHLSSQLAVGEVSPHPLHASRTTLEPTEVPQTTPTKSRERTKRRTMAASEKPRLAAGRAVGVRDLRPTPRRRQELQIRSRRRASSRRGRRRPQWPWMPQSSLHSTYRRVHSSAGPPMDGYSSGSSPPLPPVPPAETPAAPSRWSPASASAVPPAPEAVPPAPLPSGLVASSRAAESGHESAHSARRDEGVGRLGGGGGVIGSTFHALRCQHVRTLPWRPLCPRILTLRASARRAEPVAADRAPRGAMPVSGAARRHTGRCRDSTRVKTAISGAQLKRTGATAQPMPRLMKSEVCPERIRPWS